MKITRFFILNWKRSLIILVAFFISAVLHNLISGIFKTEEALFFTLAVIIIPLYLLIAIPFTVIRYIGKK